MLRVNGALDTDGHTHTHTHTYIMFEHNDIKIMMNNATKSSIV